MCKRAACCGVGARLPESVDRAAAAPARENCGKRAVQAPVEECTPPQAFPNDAACSIKGNRKLLLLMRRVKLVNLGELGGPRSLVIG